MSQERLSAGALMLLLCVLPLLVFYGLAAAGIVVSPLLVLLVMVLCCFAMFHLMGQSGHVCHHERHPMQRVSDAENVEGPLLPSVETDDIFRIERIQRVGDVLIADGKLLADPEAAQESLNARFLGKNLTPLLKEDELGRPQLVIVPGDLQNPQVKERSAWLNLALLVLTFGTTTWAGALHQGVNLVNEPNRIAVGLPYSLTLLLILGAHELGHYFAARAHRMKVSLPFFIPVPFALGTFGAFIQMKSLPKDRRALFDVGVAGPLAGLVFAIPALWFGLQHSTIVEIAKDGNLVSMHHGASVGSSVLLAFVAKASLGDVLSQGHQLVLHPLAFAGWLGLLVTALNLLPIGQLDGGHIADAMFGQRRSAGISSVAMFSLFMLGLFVWSGLLMWALIAFFIAGGKGIASANDLKPLDASRFAVGVFAFVLLFLILSPVPHAFYESLGIHCPYL